jgi:hypothetical protein
MSLLLLFGAPPASGTTWNPADKAANVTLAGGNLQAGHQIGDFAFGNARATTSKTTGKWYFEFTVAGTPINLGIGLANATSSLTAYLGSDGNSQGWYNSGFGGSASFTGGDVLGVAFDADNDLVWYAKNNTFTGNPTAGTGGTAIGLATFFPAFSSQDPADTGTANFGGTAFAYTPPSGFSAFDASSGYTLTAAAGAFVFSGGAANPRAARNLVSAAGAFTFTGGAANFGVRMPAAAGAFAFSGGAANFAVRMPAAPGSYTLTGGAASFTVGKRMTGAAGAFVLSGGGATFRATRSLIAASAGFTFAGGATALKAGRRLSTTSGAFALGGGNAGLFKTTAGAMVAAPGGFVLTGASATLQSTLRLAAAGGAISVTGGSATFRRPIRMAAAQVRYSITFGNARFRRERPWDSQPEASGTWTPAEPGNGAWSAQTPAPGTWTPATQNAATWTPEAPETPSWN